MENMEIYERCREVPASAKKTIPAGRLKGMTDISPMWRIKKLTEVFGPCGFGWYYTVTDRWTEAAGSETAAFVDIELYVKDGDEWSKPIRGTGGSKFVTQERTGLFVSDECYKMATTDALSVACKQLGIGADVYWDRDVTKYSGAEGQGAPEPQGQQNGQQGQRRRQATQGQQGGQQRQQSGQQRQQASQERQGVQRQEGFQDSQQLQMLDTQRVNSLFMELRRTGVGWKSLLANYGASDVHYLTIEQYENAMENLRRRPTKGMPEQEPEPQQEPSIPPDDMDESGLPWYEPGR